MSKIYAAARSIVQRKPKSWDDAPVWLACLVACIALLEAASFGFVVYKFGPMFGDLAFSVSPEQLTDPRFMACGIVLAACSANAWLFHEMAKGPLAVVRKRLFPA